MTKRMKRTQLYLDEETARILETLSRQKATTVSELVRTSLRERYLPAKDLDKSELARNLTGVWKRRKDLSDAGAVVRRLRRGSRPTRLRID